MNNIEHLKELVTKNYIKLSKEDEFKLRREIKKTNSSELKHQLLMSSLPFIFKKAMEFSKIPNTDPSDLFSAGIEGAMEAIDKDKIRGTHRFVAFAWYYMRMKIYKYLNKESRLISIPWGMVYDISNDEKDVPGSVANITTSLDDEKNINDKFEYQTHDDVLYMDLVTVINTELAKFSDRDRSIISMFYHNECTDKTISEKLNLDVKQVKKRRKYIISNIRSCRAIKELVAQGGL